MNKGSLNTGDGKLIPERKIIIFDLDGTIADIEHRRHFVHGKKPRWDKFYRACVDDTVNKPIQDLWQHLYTCGYPYEMQIFSGRSDEVRTETEEWLEKHHFTPSKLLMRPEGDYTPDDVLKQMWAEPILPHIHMVFDDRDKVVRMWRNLGVTCLQVADGDF